MRFSDKVTFERDLALINQIKAHNAGQALAVLFNYYLPLVKQNIRFYRICCYDQHDLLQEALVVCYLCALNFDEQQQFPFVAFFKRSLRNRLISLTRYDQAQKREATKQCSYDDVAEMISFHTSTSPDEIVAITHSHDCIAQFIEQLTPTERFVFTNYILQSITLDEFCQQNKLTKASVYTTSRRCKNKLRYLLESK